MLDQANRNLAPNLSEPREQISPIEPQPPPRLHRYDDRIFCIRGAGSELCLGGREHGLIASEVTDITAEKRENSGRVHIVDGPEAIKKNIGDSLEVVVHIERRPGRRFISEVLEINHYDPDADLFDYCVMYAKANQP